MTVWEASWRHCRHRAPARTHYDQEKHSKESICSLWPHIPDGIHHCTIVPSQRPTTCALWCTIVRHRAGPSELPLGSLPGQPAQGQIAPQISKTSSQQPRSRAIEDSQPHIPLIIPPIIPIPW